MANWITLLTFTHPSEVLILRGRLEAEGIKCFIQNEETVQMNPLYANAVGGIALQVQEHDVHKAVTLLIEYGYLKENDFRPSKFAVRLDKATSGIPFIRNLQLELRLVILFTVVISLTAAVIYWLSLPTFTERLTEEDWCVENIIYEGREYIPYSTLGIRFIGGCDESVDIDDNGEISLPGFNSYNAQGRWKMQNNRLIIYETDTFGFVYNGAYEVLIEGNSMVLQSEKTEITCFASVR